MKLLSLFLTVFASAFLFTACTNQTSPVKSSTLPVTDLEKPIPTVVITSSDPQDQQLIDELNQYQDNSLDTQLNDLDSSLK